jgi:endonuclease/exonuclease/phosphatase family metal-dependent hydrolase
MKLYGFMYIIIRLISSTVGIRFATYNIQSGSNFDHVYNITETARTIDQLDVDFIALQEVDNLTIRHDIDQTLFIAQYNVERPFQFFHFEKMRNFQNGGYGIAILSKQASIKRLMTYHYGNTTPEQCATQTEGDYCQGLIMLEIPFKTNDHTDLTIFFGTTHLGIGLNGTQQLNETKQLLSWIVDKIVNMTNKPFAILMTGDYNSIPTDDPIQLGMVTLFNDLWATGSICEKKIDPNNINGYTFDSLHPSKRIDYIFALKSSNFPTDIKINCELQVIPTLASDHRPLILNVDVSSHGTVLYNLITFSISILVMQQLTIVVCME